MDSIANAFNGAYKSSRLIYRPLEDNEDDKEFLYQNVFLDPANVGLANPVLFRPYTKKQAYGDLDGMAKCSLLAVLICLPPETSPSTNSKNKGQIIGYMTLSRFSMDSTAHCRSTRIGLQIASVYQNKGYGAEAIRWALDWAFLWAGMRRVEIGTTAYNERAVALYKKLGFVEEGRAREKVLMHGRWWDEVDFGMLEREWLAIRKREDNGGVEN